MKDRGDDVVWENCNKGVIAAVFRAILNFYFTLMDS